MAQEGSAASERACDRCRERRVKCDKRLPTCLRCEKLGKPCPGYDKKRKFVDEGIILRKKYQPASGHEESNPPTASSNNQHQPKAQTLKFPDAVSSNPASAGEVPQEAGVSSHTYDTLDEANTADISASNLLSSLGIPEATTDTNSNLPAEAIEADDTYFDIFNDPSFDPAWFDIDPSDFYGTSTTSCGFISDIPNIVDEVDRDRVWQSIEGDATTSPMSGLGFYSNNTLWATESQLNTSAIITDEREHEMAYLIRHFTEAIGPWMDLFDQDKHFGNLVPLKALRDALLRNAIAAVAAKQLGRVKGTKPYLGNQSQKPATMEVFVEVDWFYKAANYYDKAIAFSRIYLQAISGSLSNPPTPNSTLTLSTANSDDLLVAVSIFSLYESLDNLEIGWLQHLSGFKTLLNTVHPDLQTEMQIVPSITVGRRASFWNFARADYQASYINHQNTFLDTEDLQLWQSCNLQIQDNGSLYRNAGEIKNEPLNCRHTAELVSHTLLWLVLRVMNYLASDQDTTSMIRQARWLLLTNQLDEWHANLPQTFQPCAQIRYPLHSRTNLTEVFFSMNVCAAALQLYHFARILLLLHKPHESSSTTPPTGRLRAYREVSAEAVKHAHQIVGIALGRPHPAVRVEMLLPLYIAGSCLEADEERQVVLDVLRAIEKDTGCSTEVRCGELMKEWGWRGEGKEMAIGVL